MHVNSIADVVTELTRSEEFSGNKPFTTTVQDGQDFFMYEIRSNFDWITIREKRESDGKIFNYSLTRTEQGWKHDKGRTQKLTAEDPLKEIYRRLRSAAPPKEGEQPLGVPSRDKEISSTQGYDYFVQGNPASIIIERIQASTLFNFSLSRQDVPMIKHGNPRPIRERRKNWPDVDLQHIVRTDVYVVKTSLPDEEAAKKLLELLGQPSSFHWTRYSTARLRYDHIIHGSKTIEQTFVYLAKHSKR